MRFASEPSPGSRLKRAALRVLGSCILFGSVSAASGTDIYIICNTDVSLEQRDVKDVFVGEKAFAESVKLVPADNRAAQGDFLARVLKLDAGKYNIVWTKKSFRDGVNPPPVKANDAEALAFVKATSGACSYVAVPVAAGVRVVAKY